MSKSSRKRLGERRLGSKMANYNKYGGKMPASGFAMRKPGSTKK